jgi:CubicO group peptidase (beta-lactamase class C family)
MAFRRFLAATTLGVAVLASPALAQSLRPETERAIERAMEASIESGWVAGGAVAVIRSGEMVFSRGYGMANLETGTPVAPDTVFRIGSVTKQFTAAAILLLCEDGLVALDDPVARHLPRFDQDDPTTIRQLLNHTAGLVDYPGRAGFGDREMWLPLTTGQLVDYVLSAAPLHEFDPGSRWSYSSSNYAIAGAVVEAVSGQPLGAFLKARIFDPLDMHDTAMDDARDVVPRRAAGYDRARIEEPGYLNARAVSMSAPFAAGAMRSTMPDLLKWSDALTHGRVLNPESYREMTTPARLADGSPAFALAPDGTRQPISYGLGIAVPDGNGPARIGHDGAIDGFTAMVTTYLEEDLTIAAAVNTSPSDRLPFESVVQAIERELLERRP